MHGIAQVVLTPTDLLRLLVHANLAEVDLHHSSMRKGHARALAPAKA